MMVYLQTLKHFLKVKVNVNKIKVKIYINLQITSDESIFTISMILHERAHHRASITRGRVSEISESSVRSTLSLAIQRLLAHQNPDGAVSYYRTEKG
jgi:hypothetical protein